MTTEHLLRPIQGGKIVSASLVKKNKLVMKLESGKYVTLFDAGQMSNENRYMTTEDAIKALVGQTLERIDELPINTVADREVEEHQAVDVEIGTDKGVTTLTFHNEHDGNYPGFRILALEQAPSKVPEKK